MAQILDNFFMNITLIVTFMFIFLKLKETILARTSLTPRHAWIVPLFVSLLSLAVMFRPFEQDGILLDLRGIPLFLLAYVFGWRLGAVGLILPVLLRLYLGGPTVEVGIAVGILLPYVLGSLFHRPENYTPPYTIIPLRNLLAAFLVNEGARLLLISWLTAAEFRTLAVLLVFETAGIFCIALMLNDSNRSVMTVRQLETLSRTDSMTNLYNLAFFREQVSKLAEKDVPFVLAMLDVDYFKQFNDTHGHPAGDKVLRRIGQLLTETMREQDFYARYGGEEFILCFTGVRNVAEASAIAERLRRRVNEEVFEGEETQPDGRLTISIGLSNSAPGIPLDEVIKRADQALYRAKRNGRNQTAV